MTCVIYKSLSGFTKRYATLIASELECDIFELTKDNLEKIEKYQVIIFGGSLHAVGINGLKAFKEKVKHMPFEAKKCVIFAVGASPNKEGLAEEIIKANLTDMTQYQFFYLRGGFDYSKLDFKNKALMNLLKFKIKLKKNRTPDEIGMLKAYSHPLDVVSTKNIEPLIHYVKHIRFEEIK